MNAGIPEHGRVLDRANRARLARWGAREHPPRAVLVLQAHAIRTVRIRFFHTAKFAKSRFAEKIAEVKP